MTNWIQLKDGVAFAYVDSPNFVGNSIPLEDGIDPHSVMAKKHIDSKNVGNSIIVGIGTYTDGGLYVYDKTGTTRELFEIQDKPTMFNGAILPHETQEYTGERYTLIFYNQPTGLSVEGVEMVGC